MAVITSPRTPKGARFPVMLAALMVGAVIAGALALFIFLRPEVAPPIGLLDKFLPREAAIRQIEAVDFDVSRVINHPAFGELRQSVPLPLRVPATGKTNPFF